MKTIEFLKTMGNNDVGETAEVVEEDELFLYYFDGADRWCYIDKWAEGRDFISTDDSAEI